MDKNKAIELLRRQADEINVLKLADQSSSFKRWKRNTEIIIEKVFSNTSRHLEDFNGIRYSTHVFTTDDDDSGFHKAYLQGLDTAKEILSSMIDEITEFGVVDPNFSSNVDSLTVIENICARFHLVARQLRSRHQGRPTIEIDDEYDVQDLFHSLLHLHFSDIRSEEWTPGYAGGSSRIDFLLKQEQITVEIKKTRKSLSPKDIGDQLIIDSKRYKAHPDSKCLFCFIYDPEGRIGNPVGLENDLTEREKDFKIIVVIHPKGR